MDKDKLKQYQLLYFQNGLPVPLQLKNGIANIYPITVKDWSIFESSLGVLQIDKNDTDNIEQIQMSYMDFLFHLAEQNEDYKNMLVTTLLMSLHAEQIGFIREKNKPFIIIADDNQIITAKISAKEFNQIKDIIFYYNLYDYNDVEVSSDIKKLAQEYYKIKHGESYSPTLEEQKMYVIARTGMSMNDINNMSYRAFSMVYKSTIESEMFLANKIIQASFKYDIKQDVLHPLFVKKKNPYEEIFANKDEFVNKINQANNG